MCLYAAVLATDAFSLRVAYRPLNCIAYICSNADFIGAIGESRGRKYTCARYQHENKIKQDEAESNIKKVRKEKIEPRYPKIGYYKG